MSPAMDAPTPSSPPHHAHHAPLARDTHAKEPFFFGPDAAPIFGWLHDAPGDTAVVVCNPFGYEAVQAHRALRHLAERTAAAGFPTLRFDYPGTFDSAGYPGDEDEVAGWLEGVRAAARAVVARTNAARVVLLGLRLGGLLAARVLADPGDLPLAGAVLFAPIVKGRAYTREMRAFRLLQEGEPPPHAPPRLEGAEEAAGYEIRKATVAALGKLDLGALRPAGELLLLAHSEAESAVGEAWRAAGIACTALGASDYGDMMLDPHRGKIPTASIDHVAGWLATRFPPKGGVGRPSPGGPRSGAAPASSSSGSTTAGTARAIGAFASSASALFAPPPDRTPAPFATRAVREDLVRFAPDERLFGILTRPAEGEARRTAVLLLNAGAVTHTGPNRMHVHFARAWAAAGYPVLRMDTGGLGDSAPVPGTHENDTYAKGALTDAIAGVRALEELGRSTGSAPSRVVASGLCSGAYLSFHLALRKEVSGALLVNPQTFYWKDGMSLDVAPSRTYNQTKHYKAAIVRTETWKKLARGKIDLGHFARTVRSRAMQVAEARIKRAAARWFPPEGEHLRGDLKTILDAGVDLGMIFSAGDPGIDYMDLHLGEREMERLQKNPRFHFEILDGPDHTFTPVWTQPILHERLTRALLERFP